MSSVFEENKRRNELLDQYYNPLTGEGSWQERQLFELSDLEEKLYLPVSMLNLAWVQELGRIGSFSEFVKLHNNPLLDEGIIKDLFQDTRLDHDFEFWCAKCVKIKPKRGGDFIPFILNFPQRMLWQEQKSMIDKGLPIFFVLLKSRQFGGSTEIDILANYIQIRIKTNWNSLIAAHINQGASNIRSMTTNLFKYYPQKIDKITLKPFEHTQNIKIIPERSNKITIGSMETPDSIRTDDLKIAHVSEYGLMKTTLGKTPEDLIQSIIGTLPMDEPYTMFAVESTAKGVGNAFHRLWQQAVAGTNGMRPVFIPWLKDPKNRIELTNHDEFYKSFSNYDLFLWKQGATLEGIKFYHKQLSLFGGDDWRMQSEFPTTANESFQSTGNRFFPQHYVLALRKDNKEPIFKGEVVADSTLGKNSLNNIRLETNNQGNLWIWEFPDTKNQYDYRYVVSMDIGGTTDQADYSIIRAFDRLPMLKGEDPRAVFTWKGHIDQDLLAHKGIQLSKLYDNALFVPEENSFDREKEEDGEHFQTILVQIKDFYRNIYIRNDEEKVGNDFVPKYGWNTNRKTKGLAMDTLRNAARERSNAEFDKQDGYSYIEPDERACSEMDCFEIKQSGKLGAIDGSNDDLVLATGIGLHVALHIMPLPRLRAQIQQQIRRRNMSTF